MKELLRRTLPPAAIRMGVGIVSRVRGRGRARLRRYAGREAGVLDACIAYNELGGYCVPVSSHHRPAAQRILAGRIYEHETIELVVARCGRGDIVHAGTYFGDFLPALSRGCAAGARVWAFEPNPESFRCAEITCRINGLANVELRNAGLGSEPGEIELLVADESGRALGGASRLLAGGEAEAAARGARARVEIVRIDDVVPSEREVSILQLDVEGFEVAALGGARETIARSRPTIILENLPEEGWLREHILDRGYEIGPRVCNNTVIVPRGG